MGGIIHSASRVVGLAVLLVLADPDPVGGQEIKRATSRQVKAAFIRNFAHYVAWPEGTFADDDAPWKVCVLGRDPFGATLDRTLEGRTEQGRAFAVYRADSPERLPNCQIVFLADDDAVLRRAALAQWRDRPVLTVSDAPDFLSEGGIIRFDVATHVRFGINLGQARAVSLKIPTKMLEVSREVLVGGATRRQR